MTGVIARLDEDPNDVVFPKLFACPSSVSPLGGTFPIWTIFSLSSPNADKKIPRHLRRRL